MARKRTQVHVALAYDVPLQRILSRRTAFELAIRRLPAKTVGNLKAGHPGDLFRRSSEGRRGVANDGWSSGAKARARAREVGAAAAQLRRIALHSGSYLNEGSFFNASWQEEFRGRNYAKLRAIKTKYDPDGLFFVHHGVGSEEWSADGFTRDS